MKRKIITKPPLGVKVGTGEVAVSRELADAIRAMAAILERECGTDMAFAVCGNGGLIAADSDTHGIVFPKVATGAADEK